MVPVALDEIVSVPAFKFASIIACLKEPAPESDVFETSICQRFVSGILERYVCGITIPIDKISVTNPDRYHTYCHTFDINFYLSKYYSKFWQTFQPVILLFTDLPSFLACQDYFSCKRKFISRI